MAPTRLGKQNSILFYFALLFFHFVFLKKLEDWIEVIYVGYLERIFCLVAYFVDRLKLNGSDTSSSGLLRSTSYGHAPCPTKVLEKLPNIH